MSTVKYLYVTQRPDDLFTVTVYNSSNLLTGMSNVRFMIMHYSTDPIGIIQSFLTSNSFIFVPTRIATRDPNVINAYSFVVHTKIFPLTELYLTLGPLQTEVIIRMNMKIDNNTNGTAITNLQNTVSSLNEQVNIHEKSLSGYSLDIKEYRDAILSIQNSVSSLNERVSHLERSLSGYTTNIKEDRDMLMNLDLRIQALENKTYINNNYFQDNLSMVDDIQDRDQDQEQKDHIEIEKKQEQKDMDETSDTQTKDQDMQDGPIGSWWNIFRTPGY